MRMLSPTPCSMYLTDQEVREKLVTNANEYSKTNSWATRRTDYLRLVDNLVNNTPVTESP